MAAIDAATLTIFSLYPSSFSNSLFPQRQQQQPLPSSSTKLLHISSSALKLSHNRAISPLPSPPRRLGFQLCSTVEEVTVQDSEETQIENVKRKLYVLNLPWSFSVAEMKNLFGQCGTVSDVEIIKHKDGKNRNFAFVTMATGEEAQAVIDKFDAQEVSGRTIRVELAKKFKAPSPKRPPGPPSGETQNKIYVSNLAWKVRSNHLRELFSSDFNPVSAKVVFESPGKAAGYGFISFSTKEEVEAAISSLDGKELMGRPIRLKLSQRKVDEPETAKSEEEIFEDQPAESLDT